MDNGKNWWVLLIEGIVAILLGFYLLLGGNAAASNFALVAGLYVLIVGVLELWRGSGTVSRYRGIISVIVGALILLLYALGVSFYWSFTIFAIGVIIVGALGLYGSFFARSGRKFEWGPVIVNALLVLWGIMIFFARIQDFDLQNVTAWILIIMGAIVAIWGYFTRDDDTSEEDVSKTITSEEVASKIDDASDEVS